MNEKYMNEAFIEAEKALKKNEVPVGAIIVKDDKIISRAHNLKEIKKCGLYHAEIIAINKACKKLNNWRLDNCDIYVTLDPCPMCASAIKQSRIKNVYSACANGDINNSNLIKNIFDADKNNGSVNLKSNINSYKSNELLHNFFVYQRNKSK